MYDKCQGKSVDEGTTRLYFFLVFDYWKKKLGVSPLLDHPSIQCWGWLRRCFCCCLCSGFFRRKFCTQQRWWVTRWHLSGGNHGRLLKKHFPISFVYPIRNHWRFAALLSSTSTFPIVLSCTLWNNFKSLALKTLLLITSKLQRSPLTKDYFQKANGFFLQGGHDWTCLSWNHSFWIVLYNSRYSNWSHLDTCGFFCFAECPPLCKAISICIQKGNGFRYILFSHWRITQKHFRMTNRRFNKG